MSTLEAHYQNYLKENPYSTLTYEEWLDQVWEPTVSDNFQISPDGAFEHSDKEINFKDTINSLITKLGSVKYDNGDISDLGNEIGIGLGNILPGLSEDEIRMFISGFRHGVRLTNGTHSLDDILEQRQCD